METTPTGLALMFAADLNMSQKQPRLNLQKLELRLQEYQELVLS